MTEIVKIEKLGSQGDGIAFVGNEPVYIAEALPGETVMIEREGKRAHLLDIKTPSADRLKPFCQYYFSCGGCIAQHMMAELYRGWKRDIVVHALHQAGLAPEIAPLEDASGEGRRRMTLHVRMVRGEVEAGFMAPRSHALIAIESCPITVAPLHAAPKIAREIGKILRNSGKPVSIQFTASSNGLDVDIRGHGPGSDTLKQKLITLADALDLARIALHGDVLVERKPPFITMGRASVCPPAGGFLQATARGEEALAAHILTFCTGAKKVADLFSGCGPFALRLAEKAEVHAVETDKASLLALDRAFRSLPGLHRITTETRDLFRRPLLKPELEAFDAVVLDPPRAGAEAQARQIAAATVAKVVSISCDPGTFARDAAILASGGYTLEHVIPVDQFTYSAHVETVALFTRTIVKKAKRRIS